jgi:hydroxymethylpyrimidine/phosphomethylpyrimidine kinase
MVERARAIKAALGGVPLLVNDRIDVALASGADGVHIGWDDMAPADARRLLGPDAIIGLTINSPQRADVTNLDLIDYAGIGGVYGTTSKATKNKPIGTEGMARVIKALRRRKPGFAACGIAGINATNAAAVIEAGADGVSVISALSLARDPEQAARELRGVVDAALAKRGSRLTTKSAIAVTIAGSDSGGGAGIQADLKTFSALGVYGASVITVLTAQNTRGVSGIHDVPPAFIAAQIDAVFSDLAVDAVKIGMLSQAATIEAVAAGLDRHRAKNVVLDPVMVATSGDRLLDPAAVDALRKLLIPRAAVITPNLPEAAALIDTGLAGDEAAMRVQAERLLTLGAKAVLIKGGHGGGAHSVDLLVEPRGVTHLAAPRIATQNTHGTGCTLSSAIAAGLAKGLPLIEAARQAKDYVTGAILAAGDLKIGSGHGPVHHFHRWWTEHSRVAPSKERAP